MHRLYTSTMLLLTYFPIFSCTSDIDEEKTIEEITCDNIEKTDPSSNETDVPIIKMTYEVFFKDAVEWVEISINDPDGKAVEGYTTLSEDSLIAVFETDVTLAPHTTYSVDISYDECSVRYSFITGGLASPIEEGVDLMDRTYLLYLKNADIVEPVDIDDHLKEYIENILLGVIGVAETKLSFLGALPDEDEEGNIVQDTSSPTVGFLSADFDETPYFSIDPTTFDFAVIDSTITIEDPFISGIFYQDGSSFAKGVFDGDIDTRQIGDMIECQVCTSDEEVFCISLRAEEIYAEIVDRMKLITAQEPCAE